MDNKLNSRFRSLVSMMKAEKERSAQHKGLSSEEKAQIQGDLQEKQQRLQNLRKANAEMRQELEAFVQLTKPFARIVQPCSVAKIDMDLLQDLYLRMRPVRGDANAQMLFQYATGGLNRLKQLENELLHSIAIDRKRLLESESNASWPEAVDRQRNLLNGADFRAFLIDIKAAYTASLLPQTWSPPKTDLIPPIAYAWKNLFLLPECLTDFGKLCGNYGTKDGRLMIPQSFSSVIDIYPDNVQRANQLLSSVQTWVANYLLRTIPKPERVFWIDTEMMSKDSLGILLPLEGTCIATLPITPTDITDLLGRILILQQERKLCGRLLIVRWGQGTGGNGARQLQQIIANSSTSGLYVVIIHSEHSLLSHGSSDAIHFEKGNCWYFHDGKRSICTLPAPADSIPKETKDRLRQITQPVSISTKYFDYVNVDALPVRQQKADFKIVLPFGLKNNQLQSVTFWNIDFAGYLLGASGSGKSTLLHALITSLTTYYHPDDVELWLADMQNSSFSVYAHHTPPHVRYLVLDNSVDAITAFIERVYREHERRNKLRALGGVAQIWDLPRDRVPPRIFVIVDEFGPLSNALADYDSEKGMKCRKWLTELLQQSRKNGFHFLFAHQSYLNGVQGLTEEAKGQIGLRLLMAADADEKKACAAIANRTAEQDSILNSILPNQLAIRTHGQRVTEDRCLTQASQVLYLNEIDMVKIGRIADRQRKDMQYLPKQPVIVDQSHRISFSERRSFMKADLLSKKDPGLAIYPGTPRNMDLVQRITAQRRNNQSILILCDAHNSDERLQAVYDVFMAAVSSCTLQQVPVELWSENDILSERIAQSQTKDLQVFQGEQIEDRFTALYSTLQERKDNARLILISDLPLLLTRISDAEEEARLLGKPQQTKQNSAPEGADQQLFDLVQSFQMTASVNEMAGSIDKLTAILRIGPRYGTVIMACADKNTSVFPKPLKDEWFANLLLFRSGAGDFTFSKAAATLQDDQTFIYIGASDHALYTTYTFVDQKRRKDDPNVR